MSGVHILAWLFVLLLSFATCREDPHHPSDATLEENFRKHRAGFNKLVDMSNADSKLVRIASDFTWLENNAAWPRPESEIGFSEQRWNEYRQLFNELGLKHGLARREDIPGVLFFDVSATGMVTGGDAKGYAYSTEELSPLVNSLDHIDIEVKSLQPLYKRIEGDWYLYYEWDD